MAVKNARVVIESPRAAVWRRPDDVDALRAWADYLVDQGDLRGEFIHLSLLGSPTTEQVRRRNTLMRKTGALVGPARPFLRYWGFGENGLIRFAVCEAAKLVAGFEQVAALSPKLVLDLTSLRATPKQTIARLAKLPLWRIYFLRLDANGLTDAALLSLAPALKGVRHLSLAGNDITGDGLRRFASFADSLEFLCLGSTTHDARQNHATANGWADALWEAPGFRNLRAIMCFRSGTPDAVRMKRLRSLPNMRSVSVIDYQPWEDDVDDLIQGPASRDSVAATE